MDPRGPRRFFRFNPRKTRIPLRKRTVVNLQEPGPGNCPGRFPAFFLGVVTDPARLSVFPVALFWSCRLFDVLKEKGLKMKSSLKLIAIGLGLGLASTSAHAMSELISITVTPLWPTNCNPGNTMLYEVRTERDPQGVLKVNLSTTGLPDGCQVSFSDTIRFTGRVPEVETVIMTVTTCQPASVDACGFTVTATAQRESVTYTNEPCANASSGCKLIRLISCEGDEMDIQGLGGSCKCQRIESTTDLSKPNWTTVGSCTADGNGRFTFFDPQAKSGGCPQRFYRAVSVD